MSEEIETVEAFRVRARAWLAENMPTAGEWTAPEGDDLADWDRNRVLQKKLYAGGFAGICFPKEYGGLGLPHEYQAAFTEEVVGYEMPLRLNIPTFSICSAVILDMGTEEQKQKYIGGAIRGEIVMAQFLSEPKGGSDLAGVVTRAERDGDTWVINGNKIWSTAAYGADYGICLTRTDWDAPKHRGLSMFIVPIKEQRGFTLNKIRMVAGEADFCEEFFEDLVLPSDALLGAFNDGWTVASAQLMHERAAVGDASPYTSGNGFGGGGGGGLTPLALASALGKLDDPMVQDRIGWAHTMHAINAQMVKRVGYGMKTGSYPPPSGSLMRLFHAEGAWVERDVMAQIAGSAGIATTNPDVMLALENYLMRQVASLGGGSTEMARNIISERVLGMPREMATDRDVPFREVRQGR